MSIMIVEDDDDIRVTTCEFLEMEGYRATAFADGQLALDYLAGDDAELPRLILMDLNMPRMNGYSFRQAQLGSDKIKDIPCVLITAAGVPDDRKTELKISKTLKKPIDLDELLAVVSKYSQ